MREGGGCEGGGKARKTAPNEGTNEPFVRPTVLANRLYLGAKIVPVAAAAGGAEANNGSLRGGRQWGGIGRSYSSRIGRILSNFAKGLSQYLG